LHLTFTYTMVYFYCDACGESLKKNQVEKHRYKCRECCVVSCVDCGHHFRLVLCVVIAVTLSVHEGLFSVCVRQNHTSLECSSENLRRSYLARIRFRQQQQQQCSYVKSLKQIFLISSFMIVKRDVYICKYVLSSAAPVYCDCLPLLITITVPVALYPTDHVAAYLSTFIHVLIFSVLSGTVQVSSVGTIQPFRQAIRYNTIQNKKSRYTIQYRNSVPQ